MQVFTTSNKPISKKLSIHVVAYAFYGHYTNVQKVRYDRLIQTKPFLSFIKLFQISSDEAVETAKQLALQEGLLVRGVLLSYISFWSVSCGLTPFCFNFEGGHIFWSSSSCCHQGWKETWECRKTYCSMHLTPLLLTHIYTGTWLLKIRLVSSKKKKSFSSSNFRADPQRPGV